MSDIYSTLQVSPKKKRCPPTPDNDAVLTPKKLRRIIPPTPASTRRLREAKLPDHLSRLYTIHSAIQHALSHSLATCAVSPSADTGIVRNVLNHMSIMSYSGMTTQFDVGDLNRLVWLWEWDGKTVPKAAEDEDNPFLDAPRSPPSSSDWTRSAMGVVISPTTHYSKTDRKRVPAYGIGIEVDMDIDKGMETGMAAVARWTAASESRRAEFRNKLKIWAELHKDASPIPQIPTANLPRLSNSIKASSLTLALASASPKASASSFAALMPPPSPTRAASKSPVKSPSKPPMQPLIFPSIGLKSPSKSSIAFPKTPSRRQLPDRSPARSTPSTSNDTPEKVFAPTTPVHQKGTNASTVPATPTSSRRQALYERIRQKSLTNSPTKSASLQGQTGKMSRDQMLKLGQEEMRRRCLLGRLGGVAESVWMLFSTPASNTATPTSRKRKAIPTSEVITAVVKSSPVPISAAEANESLSMLTKLCPFFLKEVGIGDTEWLEMPSSTAIQNREQADATPTKKSSGRSSPGLAKGKLDNAEELVLRSPRKVKCEFGGLREVREIVRRELELHD